MRSLSYAIVGAGMAGAVLARRLAAAGHAVVILEKSGGTGGRLATRRTDFGTFDHGAQYVSARSKDLRALIANLQADGATAAWHPGDADHARFTGLPGISGLVKPLLKDITVVNRFEVASVARAGDHVQAVSTDGDRRSFDHLIVTAPSPQAHRLLADIDPVFGQLGTVRYAPCWTAMFTFDRRQESLPDTHRGGGEDVIGWLVRENARPGRSGNERFTVQAGPSWSRANLELDKPEAAAHLLTALGALYPGLDAPVHAVAHRWRYSLVEVPLGQPFLATADRRISVCGDGMLGGKVEAAHDSAAALADHLLDRS